MITREQLKNLCEDELKAFLVSGDYYRDIELTKAVMQEIENREAEKIGREPYKLIFEDLGQGGYGYCDSNEKVISINVRFLMEKLKGMWPGANALNTILHEGRHAWQYYMLDHRRNELAPEAAEAMDIERYAYISPDNPASIVDIGWRDQVFFEYASQEMEMDARHYALINMERLAEQHPENVQLQKHLESARSEEVEVVVQVMEHISDRQLQKLLRLRMERLRKIYGASFRTDHPFRNIEMICRVIKPAYHTLLRNGTVRISDRYSLVYVLYLQSRDATERGIPLAKPEDLLRIFYASLEYKRDFRLEKPETEEVEKPEKLEKKKTTIKM